MLGCEVLDSHLESFILEFLHWKFMLSFVFDMDGLFTNLFLKKATSFISRFLCTIDLLFLKIYFFLITIKERKIGECFQITYCNELEQQDMELGYGYDKIKICWHGNFQILRTWTCDDTSLNIYIILYFCIYIMKNIFFFWK